ncbi:MAG: MucB/RseB C-terminal domain-containing protein [Gammaproteobacteria bacterium]|nr:MucB/RseB C-terminal domain-containing protein [Gammaproteobacteria bacterium]
MSGARFAAVLIALVAVSPALADESARLLLTRMSQALAARNYSGEFLHSTSGHQERLRIVHRVRGGRVSERLQALERNGREMVRDGDEVVCYLPDRKLALIERRVAGKPLLGTLPQFGPDVERWYDVEIVGHDKQVLGGNARIVAVRPRDQYRFGYRLWIDERTHLPVRTELCDESGRAIERVEFSALEIRADIPDAEFEPVVDASGFRWVRQAPAPASDQLPWRIAVAPPGFRVAAAQYHSFQGSAEPVPHLVVSDGLASVSVFVEPDPRAQPPERHQGRLGSSNSFTTTIEGHQVTAVGEVPAATVQAIAVGLKPVVRPPGR